jgi:hypothetical protein
MQQARPGVPSSLPTSPAGLFFSGVHGILVVASTGHRYHCEGQVGVLGCDCELINAGCRRVLPWLGGSTGDCCSDRLIV